ncbi:MAG: hypothetical protein ACREMB_08320 [Candidatus Rokuibacteriota bacterium]
MRSALMGLAILAGVVAGCGARTAWVPRGGGPVDAALYQQDDAQCRRETAEERPPEPSSVFTRLFGRGTPDTPRYEACMRRRGWLRPGEVK